MKRNPIFAVGVAATAGALALAGCTPGGGGGDSAASASTAVRVGVDTPQSLNPQQAFTLPDYMSNRLAYDTLVRKDADGVVPGLAASWEGDASALTFTIRDGATCSDGTEITPTVVADSLQSFAENGNPSGVIDAFGGQQPEIAADDDAGTVTITPEAPNNDLLFGMATASTGIICPAGLADLETLNSGPVAGAESGPYTLETLEPGVRYGYQLRDDYDSWPEWTSDVPGDVPSEVEYVVVKDPSASANQVLSGELDLARIMPDSRARFDGNDDIELVSNPFGNFYILFNEREGSVFSDMEKRKAVAQAIDREAFDSTTTDGTGELTDTFGSQSTLCATTPPRPTLADPDPEAAAAALAGLKIRVLGANVVGANGAGNVYVEEVLRTAGAEVTLENLDIGSWAGQALGQPESWDLTIYPDLNFTGTLSQGIGNFTGTDILDGGGNIGGTQAPEAEALADQVPSATTEEERCALDAQTVQALTDDFHTIPLIVESFIYAQRPGFSVTMLGGSLDDHIFRITN